MACSGAVQEARVPRGKVLFDAVPSAAIAHIVYGQPPPSLLLSWPHLPVRARGVSVGK